MLIIQAVNYHLGACSNFMEGLIGLLFTMIIFVPIEIWNEKVNEKIRKKAISKEKADREWFKYLLGVWRGKI